MERTLWFFLHVRYRQVQRLPRSLQECLAIGRIARRCPAAAATAARARDLQPNSIAHVVNVNAVAHLSDALDAPLALFQTRRIPRQIEIDESSKALQVQFFGSRISAKQQTHLRCRNRLLQSVAAFAPKNPVQHHARLRSARVNSNLFLRQFTAQLVCKPPNGIEVLAESSWLCFASRSL